mmetsp:Transcript_32960/g.36517  ORF Transcript_32960/g.36517 Transcript_32960/m.36517 type:complete len:272 (+) Transcript_32960:54-869(+)
MPSAVVKGVNVVELADLTIKEFHGNLSTKDPKLSAVHETFSAPSVSPWRCPEFTEYILVVEGEAHVETTDAVQIVTAGCGVYLPRGCRVRVKFPGPARVIAICLPAFSPTIEHTEQEGATAPPAHKTEDAPTLFRSVDVVKAPTLTITEYFGNVASNDSRLSACVSRVDEPCSEAWQCPEFAEWVLVLKGVLHLEHAEGTTVVPAGSGVYLAADERVKWSWPEACTYVPICMPAFTPDGCRREPEEGSAKDANPDTMTELHKLHTAAGDAK